MISTPPKFTDGILPSAEMKKNGYVESIQKLLERIQKAPASEIPSIMEEQREKLDELASNKHLSDADKSTLKTLFQ